MNRSNVLGLLVLAPFSLALAGEVPADRQGGHDQMMREQPAPMREPRLETADDLRNEINALRQRVTALEALKPNFTNFMPDFSERFHVMHRAGDAGDWAVAAHEANELQRLMGVSKYIDAKLGELMPAFMGGNLGKLEEAIEHGNAKSFQSALKDAVTSCNGCHTASGSSVAVTLDVDQGLDMRHPHALRKSTASKQHKH